MKFSKPPLCHFAIMDHNSKDSSISESVTSLQTVWENIANFDLLKKDKTLKTSG